MMNESQKIQELLLENRFFYENDCANNQHRILEQAKRDVNIISKLIEKYDKTEGPRVGDFLKINDKEYIRFAYHWGDKIQTGSPTDSYYLSEGCISYSGGLNDPIPVHFFESLNTTKEGRIWIFSNDRVGAHRGVYLTVPFRSYTIKTDQDTLQQIKTMIDKDLLPEKHPLHICDPNSPQFKSVLIEYYLLRTTFKRTNPLISSVKLYYKKGV